jgi:multidrug efflux pump
VPVGIRTSFEGSAGAFQKSMSTQPLLILAALVTIYIVLGMLYESLIHPSPSCPRCPRRAWARCWR